MRLGEVSAGGVRRGGEADVPCIALTIKRIFHESAGLLLDSGGRQVATNLEGRVRNTNLPKASALLPMFEAVVNSFHAIEDTGLESDGHAIEIIVHRDQVLPNMAVDGDVIGFTVIDSGIGFDDVNVKSFFTSDTSHKLKRGGKGIGRFMWLKAFDTRRSKAIF